MQNFTVGQAILREVLAHQVLAKVISKLADKLHKAEKCVCFCMLSSICVRVCCKLVVDWGIYLIHALYILDPRVQLCINEQGSLDFLNLSMDKFGKCQKAAVQFNSKLSVSVLHTSLCCLDGSPSPLKKCMSGCVRITSRSICSIISASWKDQTLCVDTKQ